MRGKANKSNEMFARRYNEQAAADSTWYQADRCERSQHRQLRMGEATQGLESKDRHLRFIEVKKEELQERCQLKNMTVSDGL